MTQRQLPPRTTASASTTKGICLHNKRHLQTQPKTSAHALQGICPHNQRHLSPQRKAFASTIHALQGQRQLPPCTNAFASTICQKAFAATADGICQHNQRHLPTHSKAFAPTTNCIRLSTTHLPPKFTHSKEFACPYSQIRMPPQCQDILRGKDQHLVKMSAARKDTKRHLPTLQKASAHALQNQTHIPPGKSPWSAAKSQKHGWTHRCPCSSPWKLLV